MVKCQNILDLRKILISLFIVFTNETDGSDINTGLATPCESHKKELINFTFTGCLNKHLTKNKNEILNSMNWYVLRYYK